MGQGACTVQEGQQGKTERQYPVTGVCPEVRESEQRLHAPASSGTEVEPLLYEIVSLVNYFVRRGGGMICYSPVFFAFPTENSIG
ncbi:hypothetical protein D1999_14205 [Salmonella enterica]|nr:hypothetical protein [Salmonella enterica]EBL1934578.1 hypothetical protein [Salmonella enterica]ECS1629631.1 hypothetical protein [Salmonella enterica]MEJ31059.1 hypothetical protein [Salmonella enterica]PVI79730.1 hypothetical protein C4867_16945 [Salmonella enterica subsp. enterica serovar Anatum]